TALHGLSLAPAESRRYRDGAAARARADGDDLRGVALRPLLPRDGSRLPRKSQQAFPRRLRQRACVCAAVPAGVSLARTDVAHLLLVHHFLRLRASRRARADRHLLAAARDYTDRARSLRALDRRL